MTLFKSIRTAALTTAILASTALTAIAADVVIGRATEPSAIDPQFSRTNNNQMTADSMFETLLFTDPNLQMQPNLASEWKNIDPLTWEITLRNDVKFHDGSQFTADDAIFSLERTDKVPNSPAPFSDMVSSIDKLEKLDNFKFKLTTKYPNPALMEQIGRVYMVSKNVTENAKLEDFNSGKAAVGTGPYRFVEWKPAELLRMKAFDGYWGKKPDFENVEIRFIANDAARTAALLSGAVDLIDSVPPSDVARLEGQANLKVYPIESARLVYLALNMRDDTAPGVLDSSGQPITPNPFRDVRVRKAISSMIDRKLMVDRIINGSGSVSAQIVPESLGGYVKNLIPAPADPVAAKKLLAEAGFPKGFGITIYSSNNRFPGDGDIAQALGQLLARGGLKVNEVKTQPYNVYSAAATKGEYGAFIFSLGASTPNSEANLRSLLQTYDSESGTGGFNRMRYSNPAFDAALKDAMEEFDQEKRMKKLADATSIAMNDQAIVPLYFQKIYWASRKGLDFTPNLSERTIAQDVRVEK